METHEGPGGGDGFGLRRGRHERRRGGGIVFGLLLVVIGSGLLLERFDMLNLPLSDYWEYWPVLVIVWGLYRIASLESPRRVGGGLTTLLFGLWFLASTMRWGGMRWWNSWPLALVAIGSGMVLRALLERVWMPPSEPKEVRHDRC